MRWALPVIIWAAVAYTIMDMGKVVDFLLRTLGYA